MAEYRIKNWEKFQHFKDRNPPWIKLHRAILNDLEFMSLSPAQRGLLIQLWILATENDGLIKEDSKTIAWRLRVKNVELSPLIKAGFLIEHSGPAPQRCDWASRYISKTLRRQIMDRDSHKCVHCGSTQKLEIDHILPISMGGTGEYRNLQVLCRSCNRKKRAKISSLRSPDQICVADGTQIAPETETETETETENHCASDKPERVMVSNLFDKFWKSYPRKRSKGDALKAFKAIKPDEQLVATMIATIERAKKSEDWQKEGGKYVPYPARWLRARGWEDEFTSSTTPTTPGNCGKCGKPLKGYVLSDGIKVCLDCR